MSGDIKIPASPTPNIGDVCMPFLELLVPSSSYLIECSITCLGGHETVPDSLETSSNDEFSKRNESKPMRPSLGFWSHDQDSLSSSTSNASNVQSECSLSVSLVKSMQQNILNDIGEIFHLRTKDPNNPLIGFLNTNSLRNKIVDLRLVMERCLPDILVIEETKLNSDFKTEIFVINNYQKPMRRDRNECGGGLMQFVRKGVVCNRVSTFESPIIKIICSELMIFKKKWAIFGIYRPPDASNLEPFFRELSSCLNTVFDKYDIVMIMGDIKSDTHDIQHPGYAKVLSFCDVFGFTNLVKNKTFSQKIIALQLTLCSQINPDVSKIQPSLKLA